MSKLSTSCKALAGALAEACPTQQLKSLTADGEGQICLQLADADEKSVVVNFVFFDPDEYPRSGVLVQVDEDKSKCSSAVAEKLGALSERFQDGVQLWAAIVKVCGVLDIPVDEDVLRASDKQAGGTAADGDAGSGSAMEEEASDDPMSEDYPASSSGSDDGGAFLMDDQEEKELMVMCGQRQGCWRRHEDELAAQAEEGSKQKPGSSAGQPVLSKEHDKAQKQQIFSSEEAFKMLSNELLGFIRRQFTGEDANVSADSAGDDVYTWNVELWKSAFKPDCQLAKDLQEVSSKFAVSSIQLRFTFMRRLHPFFPPRVEVVRPHLSTPLPGALASYPLLRLEHWHPTLTMTQVVDNLRTFLEEYGRIDVHDPRNSLAHSPSSAFSPVQLGLSRLEACVDVKPSCYNCFRALYEARSTQGRPVDSPEPLESPSSTQQAKKPRTAGQQPAAAAAQPPAAAAPAAAAAAAAGGAVPAAAGPAAAAAAAAVAARGIVWAKGTGYGSGGYKHNPKDPVWDAKAAAAAQEAHDEQLHTILQDLAAALLAEFPSSSSSSSGGGTSAEASEAGASTDVQPPAAAEAAAGAGLSSSSSGQQQGADSSSLTLTQQQQDCIASIRDSVLQPLLATELSQVAFSELADRHSYFHPLLSVTLALCHPTLQPLLAENALAGDGDTTAAAAAGGGSKGSSAAHQQQQAQRVCSIAGAVRGLQKGASIVKKQLTKALEQRQAAASSSTAKYFTNQAEEAARQQTERSLQIADLLLDITSQVQHLKTAEETAAEAAAAAAAAPAAAAAARAGPALPARRVTRATAAQAGAAAAAGGGGAAAGTAAEQQQAGSEAYKAALKPFVMDTAQIAAFHKLKSEAEVDPSGLKARVHKVTSEIAGIERLIEVNESSSIFVRVDEDNTFLWRALITGPEDTPYSGGCFIFDMFFPPNYPTMPPKVQIITTGGGSVRFNPNLYACGKVCLSLLGTWSAGQGESWDAQASSAFQVLVSIQSLILVPEPYFNEPGYEARGNMAASQQYNEVIREATIKWAMIEQLARPPAEFADVIKTHFKLRGPYILKQIDGWITEAAAKPAHKGRLEALKATLHTELNKLA